MKNKTLHTAFLLAWIGVLSYAPVHAQWELENFPELKGFKAPDSLIGKSFKELNKIYNDNSAYWELNDNPEIADAIGKVVLEQGRLKKDSLKIAWGYLFLGQNNDNLSLYNKALSYCENTLPSPALMNIYFTLGSYHHTNSNYKQALTFAISAKKIAKKTGSYKNEFHASYFFNSLNSNWGDKKAGVLGLVENKRVFNTEQYKNEPLWT